LDTDFPIMWGWGHRTRSSEAETSVHSQAEGEQPIQVGFVPTVSDVVGDLGIQQPVTGQLTQRRQPLPGRGDYSPP
jgi:hypothetical protein